MRGKYSQQKNSPNQGGRASCTNFACMVHRSCSILLLQGGVWLLPSKIYSAPGLICSAEPHRSQPAPARWLFKCREGVGVEKRSIMIIPRPYQARCSGGQAPVLCAARLVKDLRSLTSLPHLRLLPWALEQLLCNTEMVLLF